MCDENARGRTDPRPAGCPAALDPPCPTAPGDGGPATCAGQPEIVVRGARPGPAAPLNCRTLRAPRGAGGTSRRGPASSHTGGVAVLAEPPGRTRGRSAPPTPYRSTIPPACNQRSGNARTTGSARAPTPPIAGGAAPSATATYTRASPGHGSVTTGRRPQRPSG